jgi:hypothetical protein
VATQSSCGCLTLVNARGGLIVRGLCSCQVGGITRGEEKTGTHGCQFFLFHDSLETVAADESPILVVVGTGRSRYPPCCCWFEYWLKL